jgi:hypothetical protein
LLTLPYWRDPIDGLLFLVVNQSFTHDMSI